MNPILNPRSTTHSLTCAYWNARERLRAVQAKGQGEVRRGGGASLVLRLLLPAVLLGGVSAYAQVDVKQFAPSPELGEYSVYATDTVQLPVATSGMASGGYFGSGNLMELANGTMLRSPYVTVRGNLTMGSAGGDTITGPAGNDNVVSRINVDGTFSNLGEATFIKAVEAGRLVVSANSSVFKDSVFANVISATSNQVNFKSLAQVRDSFYTNFTTIFDSVYSVKLGGASGTMTSFRPPNVTTGQVFPNPTPMGTAMVKTPVDLPGHTIVGYAGPGTQAVNAYPGSATRSNTLKRTASGLSDLPVTAVKCSTVVANAFCKGDTLQPGYYGALNLDNNGAVLIITEGFYSFTSININSGSKLVAVQPSGGRTFVHSVGDITGDGSNSFIGPADALGASGYGTRVGQFLGGTFMLIGSRNITISSDLTIWATITAPASAPYGVVHFKNQVHLFGQLFARRIYGNNNLDFGAGAYIKFDPELPVIQINRGNNFSIREDSTKPAASWVQYKDTTITVSISKANAYDVSLSWKLVDGDTDSGTLDAVWGAVAGFTTSDGVNGRPITIPKGALSTSFTFRIPNDNIYTGPRSFRIVLSNPQNAKFYATAGQDSLHDTTVVTILEDDAGGKFSFVTTDTTVDEANSKVLLGVKISQKIAVPTTIDVIYVPSRSTATQGAGGDFTFPTVMRLTFAANDTIEWFDTLKILHDLRDENTDTIRLALTNQSAGGIQAGQDTSVIKITDNDAPPALVISDATIKEPGAGKDTLGKFVVRLVDATTLATLSPDAAPERPIQYTWRTVDGTATAIDGDYTQVPSTPRTFPAGAVVDTLNVTVRGNGAHFEGTENFYVRANSLVNLNASRSDTVAVGTINDADGVPALIITGDSILEPDEPAFANIRFIVRLNKPYSDTAYDTASVPAVPVYYSWSTVDETARAGFDYDPTIGIKNRSIAARAFADTFYVRVLGDDKYEGRETFVVKIVPGLNAHDSSNIAGPKYPAHQHTAQGIINDDEMPPGVCIADSSVKEGDPPSDAMLRFRVYLGDAATCAPLTTLQAPEVPVGFMWNTADSTAAHPADYTEVPATADTFQVGTLSKLLPVTVKGDSIFEDDEYLHLQLSPSVSNGIRVRPSAVGTIIDDDERPLISIAALDSSEGNTGNKTYRFQVALSAPSTKDAVFDWRTNDTVRTDTTAAKAGEDYIAQSTVRVTIVAGATSAILPVTVVGDTKYEKHEIFQVQILPVSGISDTGNTLKTIGMIRNDDGMPSLSSITGISDFEGNAGTNNFRFRVNLSAASGLASVFHWSTLGDTGLTGAKVGEDFVGVTNAPVVILPESLGVFINVTVKGDFKYENDETFRVAAVSGAGLTASVDTGTGVILNDDQQPEVRVLDAADVPEPPTSRDSANASFKIVLSARTGVPVAVTWATADSSASRTQPDYRTSGGTVTFAQDVQDTIVVTVPVFGDSIHEGDEFFKAIISGATNATRMRDTALAKILDTDAEPAIHVDPQTVTEPGTAGAPITATVRVWIDSVSGRDVSFRWSTRDGTARFGTKDYDSLVSRSGLIPAGQTFVDLSVTVRGDSVANEGTETFRVALADVVGASGNDTSDVVSIVDATPTPTLSIASSDTVPEPADSVNVPFTITLSTPSATNIAVLVKTYAITATSGADYRKDSVWITIPDGSRTYVGYMARVYGDNRYEDSIETFEVRLDAAGAGASLGSLVKAVVGIRDDEPAPTLSISDVSTPEPETAGAIAYAVFTVTLSGPSERLVSVDWATDTSSTPGARKAYPTLDYQHASGDLSFPGDTVVKTISVAILGDSLDEYDEVYQVRLSGATVATIADATGAGTIVDTDSMPLLSIVDPDTIAEGGTAVFVALLQRPSAKDVILVWSTRDSTAIHDSDYVPVVLRKDTIPAFQNSIQLPVATKADAIAGEPIEVFLLKVDSLLNAGVGDTLGRGMIKDATGTPTISIDSVGDFSEPKSDSSVVFHVKLSTASALPVTVVFRTVSGSATVGADLADTTGVLTFAPGTTSLDLPIRIMADAFDEIAREDFTVSLTGATNAGILQPVGAGAILDDDDAPSFSVVDTVILEPVVAGDADSATLVVRLSAPSKLQATVVLNTDDSTAVSPADYLKSGRTLVFEPGEVEHVFRVAVYGDSLDEEDEWFVATLSSPANALLGDAAGRVRITDNDTAPVLSMANVSAREGDTALVIVSLARPSAKDIVFDWSTVEGTALGDIDYKTVSGTDTIRVSGTSLVLRIPVYADSIANEFNETFRVFISRAVNAVLADSDAVVTILDQTARPGLRVLTAGNVVEDPTFLVFPIVLDRPSSVPVRVSWATQEGSAKAGLDFKDTTGSVTFAPGSVRDSVKVRVLEDALYEPWIESLLVVLTQPESASIAVDRAPGGIIDDNDAPSISIDSAMPVVEGGTVLFPVRMNGLSADSLVVWWHAIDGTAKAPVDYVATSGRAVFKPGETSLTVSVVTLVDSIWEPTENFFVRIDSVRGGFIADSSEDGRRGRVSLLEEGAYPTISFDMRDTSVWERNAGKVTVTAKLSRAASVPLETGVRVDSASVATRDVDYALLGLRGDTLSIPALSRSATFQVNVIDDSLDEIDELVRLALKDLGALAPLGKTSFDLTILDDDSAPEVSFDVDTQTVDEDVGVVVVTATLTRPSAKTIDIWYSIGGTSTAGGVDHDLMPFHLSFKPGAGSTSIRFNVIDDRIDENDETVVVVLDSARNGNLKSPTRQIVVIRDNDDAPVARFVDTLKVVRENVGTVNFPIRLDHPSAQDITLRIAVRGSATLDSLRKGSDAVLDSDVVYEVRIPAGDTAATFSIRVIDDGRVEDTESVWMTMTGGTGADQKFTARSRLEILDNDRNPDVVITRPADSLRTNKPGQTITWTWDDREQPNKDTTLVEGWNRISRCATDTAGNTGCDTVHVWGDFTPPRVVITKPDSIFLTNKPVTRVCWTVIDSGATWRRVDSSRCFDTTLTEGRHVVPREACDSVGNCGRDQVVVTVDLTAPTGRFVYPPDSSRVRVVDLPARIRWIDDKDTIYVNDTLHMKNYGWNTFTATYTDKAGNVGRTSVTVYYEAPKVESGYYLDTDGDGKVDAVVVEFDSPWESDTLPSFVFDLGSEERTVEVKKADWMKSGTIGVPARDSKGKVVVEYGDTVYLAPGTTMTDKNGKIILDSATGKPVTSPVGQVYRDASGKVVYDSEGRQMYRVPSPATTAKSVPAKDDKGKVVVVNGDTVFLAPGIVKTDKDGKTIIDGETGKPATVAVGDVYRDASGKIVYDSQGRQMYVVPNPSTADRTSMIVRLPNPFKYGVTSLSAGDSGVMQVRFSVVDSTGKPRATDFRNVFPLADSVAPIIAKAVVVRTESYTGKDSVFLTPSEPLRFDSAGTWVEVRIDGKWHVVPAESLTVLKDGRIVILVEPGEDGSVRPGLEVRFGTGVSDSLGNGSDPSESKWATKVEGDPRPPLLKMELPEAVKSVPASEKSVKRDGGFVIRATDKSQESGYQWWKPGSGYTNGSDPDIRSICPDIDHCTGIELYVNRPVRMFLFIYDLAGTFVINEEMNITKEDIESLRADKLDRVRIQLQWNMRGQDGQIVGSGIYLWRVVSYVTDPSTRKVYMTNEVVKIGVKSSLE